MEEEGRKRREGGSEKGEEEGRDESEGSEERY